MQLFEAPEILFYNASAPADQRSASVIELTSTLFRTGVTGSALSYLLVAAPANAHSFPLNLPSVRAPPNRHATPRIVILWLHLQAAAAFLKHVSLEGMSSDIARLLQTPLNLLLLPCSDSLRRNLTFEVFKSS